MRKDAIYMYKYAKASPETAYGCHLNCVRLHNSIQTSLSSYEHVNSSAEKRKIDRY